jgi:hypothetical protein
MGRHKIYIPRSESLPDADKLLEIFRDARQP